jgi:hypothetical protein
MKIKENGRTFYFKTRYFLLICIFIVNYDKTIINIGHRWMELKKALRVQTHAEV